MTGPHSGGVARGSSQKFLQPAFASNSSEMRSRSSSRNRTKTSSKSLRCLPARSSLSFGSARDVIMARRLEVSWPSRTASGRSSAKASRHSAPRLALRYPFPRPATSRKHSSGPLSGVGGSGRSLLDPVEEGVEHPHRVAPAVPPEGVLVQVGLQVPGRDGVVRPADPSLHGGPEPLDSVRVHVPAHVDPLLVVHAVVRVAHAFQRVVGLEL